MSSRALRKLHGDGELPGLGLGLQQEEEDEEQLDIPKPASKKNKKKKKQVELPTNLFDVVSLFFIL